MGKPRAFGRLNDLDATNQSINQSAKPTRHGYHGNALRVDAIAAYRRLVQSSICSDSVIIVYLSCEIHEQWLGLTTCNIISSSPNLSRILTPCQVLYREDREAIERGSIALQKHVQESNVYCCSSRAAT